MHSRISRAAIYHGPRRPLTIESLLLPDLAAGEALVRIRCATICGSDLHTIAGRRAAPAPAILGHEMTGELVEAGPGGVHDSAGRELAAGERITWSMLWSCGDCFFCERNLRSKCERLFKFGHERVGDIRQLTGAYADYCHLPAGTAIFAVPEELTDAEAAPANCATATVAAVFRQAPRLKGASVVVVGTGMLGLTACAMAAVAGAKRVIAVDRSLKRLNKAHWFGATHGLLASPEVDETIRAATEGFGADCLMEFAGAPEAGELAIRSARPGGHILMAGAVFPAPAMEISGETIVRRALRITGVYNYEPEDLGAALRFLKEHRGRFPFDSLIGGTFPLQDINEAVRHSEEQKPYRTAITFS